MPPVEMKECNEKNGEEKTCSTLSEFERASLKEGQNGVVEKSTKKGYDLRGLMETSQNLRLNSATNENNCLLEINEEMKTSLAQRIGENLDH